MIKIIILLLLLFVIEIIFPFEVYKKNESFSINGERIPSYVNFKFDSVFCKKNYLMPNGKYVDDKSDGYNKNSIPESILKINAEISNQEKLNKNDLLARWILISDWGLYSNGNNPFYISYSQAKKIYPTIPTSSVILSTAYFFDYKDSTFKLSFNKMASFPSIEQSFIIYAKLLNSNQIQDNFIFLQAKDSLQKILENMKTFKSNIDTSKLIFQGYDTITSNDTNIILTYNKQETYEMIILPNYLLYTILIILVFYIFLKDKNLLKNDKSI